MAVWNPPDLISLQNSYSFSNKLLNKCAHSPPPTARKRKCGKAHSPFLAQGSGLCLLFLTSVFTAQVMWGLNTAKVKPDSPHAHLLQHTPSHAWEGKSRASQIHLLIPLHWITLSFFSAGVWTEIIIPLLIKAQINLKWRAANVLMGKGELLSSV